MKLASSIPQLLPSNRNASTESRKETKMKKTVNLTGIAMSLGIAAMLLVLTDGATGWKITAAWILWAIGLGLAIYNAKPHQGENA